MAMIEKGIQRQNLLRQRYSMRPMHFHNLRKLIPIVRFSAGEANQPRRKAIGSSSAATAINRESRLCGRNIINTLPVELLVHILKLNIKSQGLPFLPITRRTTRVQELKLVCKLWNDIIISTPGLWTDVRLGQNGPLALKMSCKSLVDVSCDYFAVPSNKGKRAEEATQTFLQLVARESQRWKSISVSGIRVTDVLLQCLQSPAPALNSLAVRVVLKYDTPAPIVTIPTMTSLRRIELTGITINWEACPLSNLISLSLFNISEAPKSAAFHSILRASPLLGSLCLRHVGTPSETDYIAAEEEQIHLDHLSTLVLETVSRSFCDHLVSSIIASSLDHLAFTSDSYHHLHADHPASLNTLLSNVIDDETSIWIHYSPDSEFVIQAGHPRSARRGR